MSHFCQNQQFFFVLVANAASFWPGSFASNAKNMLQCKKIIEKGVDLSYGTKRRLQYQDPSTDFRLSHHNRQHAVSASNILEHLEEQGASPNPTTVYRYLDKLAGEQRIMKYVADKGEKAVFQYVDEGRHCREHLHLKCVQCGRIYHLDCHFMDEVRAHLMAEHGFTLQCEGSVLYGLCRHCAQKEEQSDSDGQTAQKCACCVDTGKKP